jgi:hypothetical protein
MIRKEHLAVVGIIISSLLWVSCYSGPAYDPVQTTQQEQAAPDSDTTVAPEAESATQQAPAPSPPPPPAEPAAQEATAPRRSDSVSELAESISVARFVTDHIAAYQTLPTVLLTSTSDGSSVETAGSRFTRELSAALLQTQRVSIAASPISRQRLRVERLDQQVQADEDSMARLGAETGAQYMLLAYEDAPVRDEIIEIDIEVYDVERATIVYASRITRPSDDQEAIEANPVEDGSPGHVWRVRREFDGRTREEVLYFEAPAIRGDPRFYLSVVFRRNQNPDLSTLQVFMTSPLMGGAANSIAFHREKAYEVVYRFDEGDGTTSVWVRDGAVIDPTIDHNPLVSELIQARANRVRPESAFDFANQILESTVLRIEYTKYASNPSGLSRSSDLSEDNRAIFDVSGLTAVMNQRGISEDEIQTAAQNADF